MREKRYRSVVLCPNCGEEIGGFGCCTKCGSGWSVMNQPIETICEKRVDEFKWHKPWTWLSKPKWMRVEE